MATAVAQDEIQELWHKFKADMTSQELRNRLVEQYLPLVKYNGERIWARLPEGVELDDLVSAGVFGLMDAIDAFDLTRGVKFETYCVPRIRGAMLDELRTMDWVPRLVRSKASKLNEAMKTLEAKLGRTPSEVEMGEHMQISVQELEKMMLEANAVNLISLNKKWYETDSYKDVREIDILEDKTRRRSHAADSEKRPDAVGHQRPEPQRTADHHSVLLRRADDERDRRHARSFRKPRQPDAQFDRATPAKPTLPPPPGICELKEW